VAGVGDLAVGARSGEPARLGATVGGREVAVGGAGVEVGNLQDLRAHGLEGLQPGKTVSQLSICSLDQREDRLPLFDDIGGQLGRVAAADVAHRMDRSGRDE
jgi:hypothetical protein